MSGGDQAELFDPPTIPAHQRSGWARARAERDQALRVVESHGDPEWADLALEVVKATAERMREFYVDDLWEAGLHPTVDDRSLGPVMRRAARLGYCLKTNRVAPSIRSHLSGKPIWASLVYQGEGA
jgi:hypothetical protein